MTKIVSSSTDSSENAACSSAEPLSSTLQRARTIEPSDGIDAPATAPVTSRVHTGARNSAQQMSATVLAAKKITSGRSTRPCPNRSASRATWGEQTA